MLSIIGLILNFLGALTLASNAVRTKGQILGVSRQIVPVLKGVERIEKKEYDRALLKMPKVKQQICQSYVAIIGLALLTIGFLLQLISSICS